ncbi:cation efflux system protein [Aliidongia dinghuensis]|uniref:Cation efflux system protein n=1 Tax=Aliidongia dinghuensis TaxID=1867774 RepID=A0A8J3E6A9_9PROT|nr:efflux RND transporter periplasmic adaptor subunit [Aliidongia dinghuensis]GGF42788.1 cation efflux system protein [Aliidongia dinghuensis]
MRALLFASAALGLALSSVALADEAARQPLYYQDPDGKPFYSAGPKKTADGRDFKPVLEDGAPSAATSAAAPPAASAKADHRILYYRNPMGLPDTSPKPKKDSMGMDYLPVYADEGTTGDPPGTVKISPGRLQTLGVKTEAVATRTASGPTIRATGILQFDERRLATVTTKVPGWIEHLAVAATGDPVRRGQVLAEIYAPDLVASENEYLIAARMGGAIGAASDERLRALDVPADEIARLRKTGKAVRRIAVMAPADGVVIDKPIQEGMKVEAGEALYKTADLSSLWLIAEVQERDLGMIRPGERAQASFVAFPGRSFEGTVDFVYPSLSAETRTARVRIVLPNPDGALRAQMFATVDIEGAASGAPILSVPNSAVLDSGTRQVVLVAKDEGRFEPRPVKLGMHGDDWVQVLDGLKPGERVVTGANFLIDAESNLRAALQGFADASNKEAQP